MTPDPPSSPENNPGLPQRHRLSLEKLRKEALESELWNLEDGNEPAHGDSTPPQKTINPAASGEWESHLPGKKSRHAPDESAAAEPAVAPLKSDAGLRYPRETPRHGEPAARAPVHDDLGELEGIDDWDDDDTPMPTARPVPDPAIKSSEDAPVTSGDTNTEAPLVAAHAVENRRKSSINLKEIIPISGVAVVLLIIAGFFLINAFSGLPRVTDPHQKPDLPAKGGHFTINSADSYWRIPITSGPDPDTVQRGTELMPILEITVTGENAALRVQFRNSDGSAVGDPITHPVRGETSLVIPSTAGLEDINIHNAYRTNLIDPWTAEILEAPAGTTAGGAFRSLITVPISPTRR